MRKLIIAVILLALLSSPVLAADFRNLSWGDPVERLGAREMMDFNLGHGVSVYRKDFESMFLGDVQIAEINYFYWQNKLYLIMIYGIDLNEFTRIAEAKYGKPYRVEGTSRYYAKGDTACEVEIIGGNAVMTLYSISLHTAAEASEDDPANAF